MIKAPIIKVAINTPVDRLFDYRHPATHAGPVAPGMRVRVPFGRRTVVGVIAGTAAESDIPADRLKAALEVLDTEPLLDAALLEMLLWGAAYYQHAVGEVVAAALPTPLRQGAAAEPGETVHWELTAAGRDQGVAALPGNAAAQRRLVTLLQTHDRLDAATMRAAHPGFRAPLKALISKGWVQERRAREALNPELPAPDMPPVLNDWQAKAIAGVPPSGFTPCLLEGVTGSGKTEVYLHLIMQQLTAGRRALVVVPEIGLTPQLLERFARRLQQPIAVLHSGLTDTQRTANWIAARNGEAAVIVGTRSAIFAPLPGLGLIIVDEEHDGSFKQQDGFRYSARDLAVWRARQLDVPVVLGSA
ncbi:MAG: DEAD/DEAH box helicase, partial [Gammaproteobacteria bacterium]|nr:DEAD/DEAH box helicase [Gammaproteobacteria bacterium]